MTAPTQLRNHWWWRPNWRVGQRLYACHLTFERCEALHATVDAYQDALAGVMQLDQIPRRWLHLTMQGIGFAGDMSKETLAQIVERAGEALAELEPPTLQLGRAEVAGNGEAILMPALDGDELTDLREVIREAIAGVRGADRAPSGSGPFRPHVSIAYANGEADASTAQAVLDSVRARSVRMTVTDVPLLLFHRDNRMYEWTEMLRMPIGGPNR
ncbi:MAG TPA: 2'-5' RNA ligase family protein [Candidatus Dormibacteraeota bacterium]|nr:2'-5' RNA ligase family protein [Candidatus Dormibacteraeota bacterium]